MLRNKFNAFSIEMKPKQTLVFIIIFVSSFSCNSPSESKAGKDIQIADANASIITDERGKTETYENFNSFLDEFSNNRRFQLKRIVFPIKVVVPNVEEGPGLTPMEETVEKHNWELLDLSYDSTYATREYDKYVQTINFRKDTAHVALRGIDNGIYADYYFKAINGKWYLVTLSE